MTVSSEKVKMAFTKSFAPNFHEMNLFVEAEVAYLKTVDG